MAHRLSLLTLSEINVMLAIDARDGDAYPLTILEEIEHRIERRNSLSVIYDTLARLERRGLVVARDSDLHPIGGRGPKRLYSLTDSGKGVLISALADVDRMRAA